MLDVTLILAAAACWLAAGLLALVPRTGERMFVALGIAGALLAGIGALHTLFSVPASSMDFMFWRLPARMEVDALSTAFLLPLQVVAGLGVVYGIEYWPLNASPGSAKGTGKSLRFFYGLLVAAMTVLFVARQGLMFLLAWEAMAVAAYFLINTEHERPEVQRASWIYLVSTHTGTAALTVMVILLAHRSGGLLWLPFKAASSPALDIGILALAVVGFGFKAGLLPLHYWLPAAHAGAPSHVSALLSAVMLKAGIYGILRVSSLLPVIPRGVGGLLLALGAFTALYGVGNALAQRDYKRLLAYSSMENLGIIAMGVGLGWTGRAAHDPWLAALGFGGAVFHVWNHGIFKSLLFFGAGSVLHATGTRDIEGLGGLAARMPKTALVIFPAVLAVAALPPFNAFLSEWFIYRGLFASLMRGYPWSAGLALPALALTGGLAGVAFAKFFGVVFLGAPRSEAADHAHDPHPVMLVPMGILSVLCLAMGLGSVLLLPLLDKIVAVLAPGTGPLLVPGLGWDLRMLSLTAAFLMVFALAAWVWLRRPGSGPALGVAAPPTWDCGYAAPTGRMQYTGSSFADGWAMLVPGLRIRIRRLKGFFPRALAFHSEFQDVVGEGFVEPRTGRIAERLLRLRRLQPGYLSVYILYVLITLLGVFLWMLLRARLWG